MVAPEVDAIKIIEGTSPAGAHQSENQQPTRTAIINVTDDECSTKHEIKENQGRARGVLFTLPQNDEVEEKTIEHCAVAVLLPPIWIQEVFLVVVFHIILPTADTISDLRLIIIFFDESQPVWAGLLLVPFLVNYFTTLHSWWQFDLGHRRYSWPASLLGCYPQLVAVRVLYWLCKDEERGLEEKKRMERDLAELEPVLEAMPTVAVLTFLVNRATAAEWHLIIGDVGSMKDRYLFLLTYALSVISACLGLAKCLKVGVVRILPEGGFCSFGFLLVFFSIFFTFCGRGFFMVLLINGSMWTEDHNPADPVSLLSRILRNYNTFEGEPTEVLSIPVRVGIVFAMILHGPLISSLLTCTFASSPRTLLSHPSILVLPMFTFYTFKTTKSCWSKKPGDRMELVMSLKDTIINVCVSLVGFFAATVLMACYLGLRVFNQHEMVLALVMVTLGVALTLYVLLMSHCCPTSSLAPALEFNVYRPHLEKVPVWKNRNSVGAETSQQ